MPSEAAFAAAAKMGREYAIDMRARYTDDDDYVQEAQLALIVEWPTLLVRYPDGIRYRTMRTVIRNRLHDYRRRDRGRLPKSNMLRRPPISLDRAIADVIEMQDLQSFAPLKAAIEMQLIDPSECVEDDVLDRLYMEDQPARLKALIEELVTPMPSHWRNRYRVVCRGLARGDSTATTARKLGISAPRVSNLVADLRAAAVRTDRSGSSRR